MTVLRREDVQSRVASWDGRPYRIASSPILAIVPLIIRRLRGPSPNRLTMPFTNPYLAREPCLIDPLFRRRRRRLERRPEEAGQLARDRHHDLGRWLVLFHQASEAATQSLLRLVRNCNHTDRVVPCAVARARPPTPGRC